MTSTLLVQLAPLAAVLLGGGVGVTLVAQIIRKLAGSNLKSKHVIRFMVGALSFGAAGLQYVTSLKGLPPTVLGVSAPAIYGFSQLAYQYVIKTTGFLEQVDAKETLPQQPLSATTVSVGGGTQTVTMAHTPATVFTPTDPNTANF
jgi:hypothetical protein